MENKITAFTPLVATYQSHKATGRAFIINGQIFSSLDEVKRVYPHNLPVSEFLRRVREFKVYGIDVTLEPYETIRKITVTKGEVREETRTEVALRVMDEKTTSGATLTGNLLKVALDFVDSIFTKKLPQYQEKVEEYRQQIRQLEELLQRKWEKEEEFQEKWRRLQELALELKGEIKEVTMTGEEPPPAEELTKAPMLKFPRMTHLKAAGHHADEEQ
jgi:hypothetical protein